jgi:hypothetical protein
MAIYDKFNVIENHLKSEYSEKILLSKVDNYLENYITTDMKILLPDFLKQIEWFNLISIDNLLKKVDYYIKNHLIQRRNNIRSNIKKDNFTLDDLNNFISNFINKLESLNSLIKLENNKIIKEGIQQLSILIISDSFILMFIEEQISENVNIAKLIEITKNINQYDNFETYNKIIQLIGNVYKKKILDQEEPPLSTNLKILYDFRESMNYCKKLMEIFDYIKNDFIKINYQIYHLLFDKLTNIIKNNSIDEITYLFENEWININTILVKISFEDKDKLLNVLSSEFMTFTDKTLKIDNKSDNIFKIINILKYMEIIINNNQFKEIINQQISKSISVDDINKNIDYLMKEQYELGDYLIDNEKVIIFTKQISCLINLISGIKNKDVFINKYHENLVARLTYMLCKNFRQTKFFELENKNIELLKIKLGDKMIYKLVKVLNDTYNSCINNINFNKLIYDNFTNKMTVITTSYNNWNVNLNEGIINDAIIQNIENTILGKHMKNYSSFYKLNNENKILNWFPHFGEVNITYMNKEIIMLPLQFMVLEQFENTNKIQLKDILELSIFQNYHSKFVNDIIGSLITSNILQTKNEKYLILNNNNPDIIKNNLIEIFFTLSDYAIIFEQRKYDELILSRTEIICANINHIVKKNPLSKIELFKKLCDDINVFELTEDNFLIALKYMIDHDYISYNNDIIAKLLY